eukprot:3486209-Pyramimonas_sp.AAC.1
MGSPTDHPPSLVRFLSQRGATCAFSRPIVVAPPKLGDPFWATRADEDAAEDPRGGAQVEKDPFQVPMWMLGAPRWMLGAPMR